MIYVFIFCVLNKAKGLFFFFQMSAPSADEFKKFLSEFKAYDMVSVKVFFFSFLSFLCVSLLFLCFLR